MWKFYLKNQQHQIRIMKPITRQPTCAHQKLAIFSIERGFVLNVRNFHNVTSLTNSSCI